MAGNATPQRYDLLTGMTTPGSGSRIANLAADKCIDVAVLGTGAVTAQIVIEVRNMSASIVGLEDAGYTPLLTFNLSGNGAVSQGVFSSAPWHSMRARLVSITGTGAAAYASVGA